MTRVILPSGVTLTISPWLGSTAYRLPRSESMLNHEPSGSKSSSSGCATGWLRWYALRSATSVQLWSGLTRTTPFGMDGTPCEQPAPASKA